jgi:hypothetical protein
MILSASLPSFPTLKASTLSPQRSPMRGSGKEGPREPTMTKLSQSLQDQLSKANLSFQTILKQIGSEFRESSNPHTTEVKDHPSNRCLSPSVCLCLSVSPSLCLPPSLTHSLTHSLTLTHSHTHPLYTATKT